VLYQFSIDFQPLTLSYSILDTDPCDGLADIVIIAQGGEPPYEYLLDFGDFQSSNTFQDLVSGEYSVLVADSEGQSAELNLIEIEVSEALFASVISNGSNLAVSGSGGTPPYAFSLNGMPAQTDSLFQDLAPGVYFIVVTDALGCNTMVSQTILNSSLVTLNSAWELQISPDPNSGKFELTGGNTLRELKCAVLDVTGRTVQSFDIPAREDAIFSKVDLSAQADGFYMLHVTDGTKQENLPLIKMR
jgi:hypothetical protein